MAAAPLGALLLLLLPGAVPAPPPSPRLVLARASRGCAAPPLPVTWDAAPALTARAGTEVTLECGFRAEHRPAWVTWERAPPSLGGALPPSWVTWSGGSAGKEGRARLALPALASRDAGTYRCRVTDETGAQARSCGTALRVTPLLPAPFLPLSEATKNRVMVAEGLLLLGAAVGPGLLLLLRKRWANERLLQEKKSCEEEENVYEGLTMEGGSLYESLTGREQQQLQYQDVGELREAELETP